MTATHDADLVRRIASARSLRRRLHASDRPLELVAGYAIQEQLAAGRRLSGFKLGMVSAAKQQQMGIDAPLCERVFADMLYDGPLPLDRFMQPRLEPEVVAVLRERVPEGADAERAIAAVAGFRLGVDVLDTVWDGYRFSQSVYLRGFEDHYHHSLKVTESPEPGLGHFALRTSSPQALRRRVAALEAAGAGEGWAQEEIGHGPAFRFRTPDGHSGELLWEVEYFRAPAGQQSVIHSRPQKRSLRGVPVRRLDHVNLMAADVPATKDFFVEQLGFRETENIIFTDGTYVGAWLSVSNLTHELSVMMDQTGARGRFHHVCFWYGSPQHVADAAEHFREHGITLETAPGKHGVTQGTSSTSSNQAATASSCSATSATSSSIPRGRRGRGTSTRWTSSRTSTAARCRPSTSPARSPSPRASACWYGR